MKTIKSVIMLVIGLTLPPFAAFSQDGTGSTNLPKSVPFLASRATLRAYAGELARSADLEIKSKGFVDFPSAGFGTGWDKPKSLPEIQTYLNAWDYSFRMSNPKDYVTMKGTIRSFDWDPLFESYEATVQPQLVSGGAYSIPQPFLYFRMSTNGIPIRFDKSIVRAKVSFVGDNGVTIVDRELKVGNGGKVYFDPEFPGKGLLILGDKDGNEIVYDLHNDGVRIPLAHARFNGAQVYVEGMYSYKNPESINFTAWSYLGIGENPTLEITMTKQFAVKVFMKSNEEARPRGFWVRPQGGANWAYYNRVVPAESVLIPLDIGTAYVVPDWDPVEFREPDPIVYPQPYYGEKGGLIGVGSVPEPVQPAPVEVK